MNTIEHQRRDTDRDIFYHVTQKNQRNKDRDKVFLFLAFANSGLLFCVAIDWLWWNNAVKLAEVLAFVYFFLLAGCNWGYEDRYKTGVLSEIREKLECWKNYYEGPIFANSYQYVPIKLGDYILLHKKNTTGEYGIYEYMFFTYDKYDKLALARCSARTAATKKVALEKTLALSYNTEITPPTIIIPT